jgi:hypothetical protein
MTFKELKLKIKNELKQLAQEIRIGKSLRKPHLYAQAPPEHRKLARICEGNRDDFRHKHIMYCHMFNGTPYDKIEQPREDNGPRSWLLDEYRKKWESMLDEDVRNSA